MKLAYGLLFIGPKLPKSSDPTDGPIGLPTTSLDGELGGDPLKAAF